MSVRSALEYMRSLRFRFALYQLKKVDTEKIFQLNNFSKVDNSDIFV